MRRRIGSERSNLGEHSSTSIVRMSTEAMWLTRLKNEHERWRYNKLMKQLLSSEKIVKHHTEKELESLKDDYLKMLAYGSVYKEFSFGKYDSARSDDSRTLLQRQDFKSSTTLNSSTEDQTKHSQSTQCHELPLIHSNNSKNEATNGNRSPWARLKSPRTRLPSGEDIIHLVRPKSKLLSCSDIETNDSNKNFESNFPPASNKDVGKEAKHSNVSQRPKSVSWTDPLTTNEDDDNKSNVSPRSKPLSVTDQLVTGASSPSPSFPAKSIDDVVREEAFHVPTSPKPQVNKEEDESEEDKRCKMALMSALAIKLQALIMWRQKMSHPKLEKSSSARQRVRRKVTDPSKVRERPHTLFPGDCKTVWAMKKFMDKEADSKLSILNSVPKRNRAKLDKLIEKVKLPDLIDRGKTTSAIFRDFRLYKDSQKDEAIVRGEHVTEETTKPLLFEEDTSIDYKL